MRITVYLPDDTYMRLTRLSELSRMSASAVVRQGVNDLYMRLCQRQMSIDDIEHVASAALQMRQAVEKETP